MVESYIIKLVHKKKYANKTADQEEAQQLSRKMKNFQELYEMEKPKKNVGRKMHRKNEDALHNEIYTEESSSKPARTDILGSLLKNHDNKIKVKRKQKPLYLNVRNDSSEEEVEEFIHRGAYSISAQQISPAKIFNKIRY